MSELMQVKWYATIGRKDLFADAVAEWAPIALKYGATKVAVHVDFDDQYKINQLTWCPNHEAWYAFWEGPEMVEFRARYLGKYQVPIVYSWATEIAIAEKTEEGEVEVERNKLPDAPSMSASDGF